MAATRRRSGPKIRPLRQHMHDQAPVPPLCSPALPSNQTSGRTDGQPSSTYMRTSPDADARVMHSSMHIILTPCRPIR